MASGTGNSSLINPVPVESNSSLLHNAHPIGLPNSIGGNSASYQSFGGYVPKKIAPLKIATKKGKTRGGGSKQRRSRKSRRNTKSKRSKK